MRTAIIDLAAISSNVQRLREAAGGTACMVVVKADGYGHGAVPAAQAAIEGGAQWLGVADLGEAMRLRVAGIREPILAWLHDPAADFEDAVAHDITVGVSYAAQLDAVAATPRTADAHLKVDTGLGRNGAAPGDWERFFAAAATHERAGRIRVTGLWSHLAGADDDAQVHAFESAVDAARAAGLHPELLHLAATGGAIRTPSARFSLVRFGIGAYGLRPGANDEMAQWPSLTPAMELRGSIASVKRVPAGSGVSYDHTYVTERETTLALVPLGYADGVPRQASGAAPVWIGGVIHRVAGRVAMDQFVVDVGDAPVAVGDPAVLFGDPARGYPSADDWATAAGTINYDIVTGVGSRVTRSYLP